MFISMSNIFWGEYVRALGNIIDFPMFGWDPENDVENVYRCLFGTENSPKLETSENQCISRPMTQK